MTSFNAESLPGDFSVNADRTSLEHRPILDHEAAVEQVGNVLVKLFGQQFSEERLAAEVDAQNQTIVAGARARRPENGAVAAEADQQIRARQMLGRLLRLPGH